MMIGLQGSELALDQGLASAISAMTGGSQNALNTLATGGNQALGRISPFTDAGTSANNLQAALSGALGNEAQATAFSNYLESPEVAFMREQGERGVLRNAAALGGLQGGNVQKDLMRFNQALAGTGLDKTFSRLDSVSNRGLNAGTTEAGIIQNATNAGAGIQERLGQNAGNLNYSTALNKSAGRTRAGELLGNQINNTTSALAQLKQQQGAGVSDILGGATSNIANLISGLGQGQNATQQQLAAIIANLAGMQGSTISGLPGIPGVQQNGGILPGLGALSGGLGTMIGAIKDN